MVERIKCTIKLLINKEFLKVYSHPRSGTHFLEAFLGENFYRDKDLATKNIKWGHWSNRKIKEAGNPYGKLFGNHFLAERNSNFRPKIYIVRDVRAVVYSIWKTDNFLNIDTKNLTFKEFLDYKIDWIGTPARRNDKNQTIIEHWYKHVENWLVLQQSDPNLLIIRYEDLVQNPYQVYRQIRKKFFLFKFIKNPSKLNEIKEPVGLLPNKAKIDSWKTAFDSEDIAKVYSIVPVQLHKFLVD